MSIDKLYHRTEKLLGVAEGYTEIPDLAVLMKACRLKSFERFYRRDKSITLHRHWFDEFGNSMKLVDKKPTIILGDCTLRNKYIPFTDLYAGLALFQVAKISTKAFLLTGEEAVVISYLGMDGFLRTYTNINGSWQQISPLYLGMKNLIFFIQHRNDSEEVREMRKKVDLQVFPCQMDRGWLISLPISERALYQLRRNYEGAAKVLEGGR